MVGAQAREAVDHGEESKHAAADQDAFLQGQAQLEARILGLRGSGAENDLSGIDLSGMHIGRAEAFGKVAAFLCSARASYVTGTAVLIDGGFTNGV